MSLMALKKAIIPYSETPIVDESITQYFGRSEEGIIRILSGERWEQSFADYIRYIHELHYLTPKPFDGIIDLLESLKQLNIPIFLLTGKSIASASVSLKEYKIDHYFEHIETGGLHKNTKPESLRHILSLYNIAPEEMLYIGDTPSDITSCDEVGVTCLSVTWASTTSDEEIRALNPEHTFSEVSELSSYILSKVTP